MDYRQFIKKLDVPPDFPVPSRLSYEDIVAIMITRDDLSDDVAGINASIELIQRTRGGGWPTEPVTEEGNFIDLVWHEVEYRDADSFTYVVRTTQGEYLGCAYLYPMGRRTELTEELLRHDVDVSWWVTPAAYDRGAYVTLFHALRHWLATALPFKDPYYSNREIPASAE